MKKKRKTPVQAYMARIGSMGGKKAKHRLTSAQAKKMVAARERKRCAKAKRGTAETE